jgi:peptidoglycan/xylan/chitin deacetylase (PgdA/CDA1 family)
MFFGKNKAITFSYDDGVTQDIRLMQLFSKYGLRATFNLNSELLGREGALVRDGVKVNHIKVKPEDVRAVYDGYEIAAHTLTHPLLPAIENDDEIVRQVEEDRLNLSRIMGYEVVGMAYPCGGVNCNEHVAELVKNHTGIKYARTTLKTDSFDLQDNLYLYVPSNAYHAYTYEKTMALCKRFLELETDKPQICYLWGHSYEIDFGENRWEYMEDICKLLSGHDDIFYGTNAEVLL